MKKLGLALVLTSLFLGLTAQERCGLPHYEDMLTEKYPEYKQARLSVEEDTQKWIEQTKASKLQQSTIITVPVVVHVVWNTTAENISDAQVQSQIDILNEDFRRTNADASNTPAVFASVAADTEIEFCLATVDPSGNTTTGITRTQTSVTKFYISDDYMKSTANGGIDPWNQNDYLNIWVCDLGGSLLGYATPPSGWTNPADGVVIGYKFFGDIGTAQAPYNKGRTATHEVGHWLNLDHVWGDANCGNDNVSDTPKSQTANYSCPTHPHNVNSCGTNADGEMFMNYMDYVDDGCMNMFTEGQKDRMIAAINNYRSNILTQTICTSSGTGGAPCVSVNAPLSEDFQTTIPSTWSINNPDGDKTWTLTNTAGYNSTSSIMIDNSNYAANGEIDDLDLQSIDLTSLSTASLSFDYAYSLWTNPSLSPNYSDTLEIWASRDCGVNFERIWVKYGVGLVTTSPAYVGATWTPSGNSDWDSEVIDLSSYLAEDDLVIRFRNITDYENSLFLDNINISGTTTAVSENQFDKVSLVPNPVTDVLTLSSEYAIESVECYNVKGQVMRLDMNSRGQQFKIETISLPKGVYFLRIKTNNQLVQKKFIKI